MRRTTTNKPDPRHETYLFLLSLLVFLGGMLLLLSEDRFDPLGVGCVSAVVWYWLRSDIGGKR